MSSDDPETCSQRQDQPGLHVPDPPACWSLDDWTLWFFRDASSAALLFLMSASSFPILRIYGDKRLSALFLYAMQLKGHYAQVHSANGV